MGQTGQTEQAFLNDLDKKLWTAADKLRSNLDAAQYKHAVLGLIFLKYVSDAFDERRRELEAQFRDKKHDYYLDPVDFDDIEAAIANELEVRDYYTEKNVFWVPALARWQFLQNHAKVPAGTVLKVKNGKTTEYKFTSLGRFIDDALDAVGLNPDEIAFYDALADNESAVRELGDDTLKKIAAEITEKLRKSTVVDWQKRESVRAKLRILVRRTLQKWKYPPDKQDAAVELVLKQAEGIAEGWSPAA